MHRFLRSVFCVLIALLALSHARTADAQPKGRYSVSVITMSPGDPIFYRFGHNAILVHDAVERVHLVFNWGTFEFEDDMASKFLNGRLTYWLSVGDLAPQLRHYDKEGRWVVEQELALTDLQTLLLMQKLEENARPENVKYRYHYYRDNCSTRVRDAVDGVIGGRLRAVSEGPARLTFRGQTSRLVADVWAGYVFLNLAMGNYIDQPISEWEEMFVPDKVHEMLKKATNVDETGKIVPLVRAERTLVKAPDRKPTPADPPSRTVPHLIVGLLVGALFGWLGNRFLSGMRENKGRATIPRAKRLALAIPLALLTLLTGFLGSLFVFFWTMTDHEVAYHNENLLQTSPLSVALLVVSIGIMVGWQWAIRSFRWVAYALAGMSILGLILKLLPWFNQVNGDCIALLMPIWIGIAAGPVLSEMRKKREVSNTATQNAAA